MCLINILKLLLDEFIGNIFKWSVLTVMKLLSILIQVIFMVFLTAIFIIAIPAMLALVATRRLVDRLELWLMRRFGR